jgi:rare lipoprotein A
MRFLLPIVLVAVVSPASSAFAEAEPAQAYGRGAHRILTPVEEAIRRAESEGRFERRSTPAAESGDVVENLANYLASQTGEGTYYGGRFHGRRTASGERFDQNALTAAHPTYPFGTRVRVTNLQNGRSIVVRINDRGPFGPARVAAEKVIDVSYAAARELDFLRQGRVLVRLDVLEWGG